MVTKQKISENGYTEPKKKKQQYQRVTVRTTENGYTEPKKKQYQSRS